MNWSLTVNKQCRPLKEGVFLRLAFRISLLVLFAFVCLPRLEAQIFPIIREIRIQGNQYSEEDEIRKVIKSKLGEPPSEEKIREDMQAVYEIGVFSCISVLKEETEDGVILIFQVIEIGQITEIEFEGIESKEISKAKKLLTFKEGELWDFNKVKESREEILQFYHKKGFFSASVEIFYVSMEEDGCKVVIKILKGESIKVKEIEIEGNSLFSGSKINSLILMEPKWRTFLFGRFFNEKTLGDDLEKIKSLYQKQGYYEAYFKKPRFEFFTEEGTKWVRVFLEIIEGKKFFVSELEVRGNEVFSTPQILSQFRPGEGEVFRPNYLENSISSLQSKYKERGYLYQRIEPNLEFDKEKGRVSIILRVNEGPQVKIGKIIIEGNRLTGPRVFRHTLLIKEGDIFNINKLREGMRKLYNLGFFENVEVELLPTPSSSLVDLLIKVEEAERRGQFYIGVGYGGDVGWQGRFQLLKDNLWGQGKRIGIEGEIGQIKSQYNITYLDRWCRDTSIHLEASLYKKEDKYEDYEKETLIGGGLKLGRPLGKFSQIYISLKREEGKITITGGTPPDVVQGPFTSYSLESSLNRDTTVRDEAFNPYRGSYGFVSAEITKEENGSTFTKYRGEWRGYLRKGEFWKSPIAAYRLRANWGEELPDYEEFRVGGIETLRGYKRNEFNGDKALLGSLELRLPLDKNILGFLFVDVGKAWGGDPPMEDFKLGWGFGVRVSTAIAPLRLEYGIGEDGEGRFYFGMGEGF